MMINTPELSNGKRSTRNKGDLNMSSRTFKVTRTAGACGLCNVSFAMGDEAFYLTCKGNAARPDAQIESSNRAQGYSTGFRNVPADWTVRYGRRTATRFQWQELVAGQWRDVAVWSNMTHVSCARGRGYRVSGAETTARPGTRTRGHEHRLNPEMPQAENIPAVRWRIEEREAQLQAGTVRAAEVRAPQGVTVAQAVESGGTIQATTTGVTERRPVSDSTLEYMAQYSPEGDNGLRAREERRAQAERIRERNRAARGEVRTVNAEGNRALDLSDGPSTATLPPIPPFRKLDID